MYRFLLRPRWIAFHVLVLAAIVLMVNLGFWQWSRLQERQDFNALVTERLQQPVEQNIGVLVNPSTVPDDVEWLAVQATGEYLADEQVVIVNRSQDGAAGVNVVTPLTLTDGSLLLVNRGFVPAGQPTPDPPNGVVTIRGRLRTSQERSLGQLSDPIDGDLQELQRIDIDRIGEQLPRSVVPVYLDLRVTEPPQDPPPFPVPDPELNEGSHLSYMVQWFIFSAFVALGWILAVRRSAARHAKQTARAEPEAVAVSEPGVRTPPGSPSPDGDEAATTPS